MTHDEYLALRARFGAKRRAAPAPASSAVESAAGCAACGQAVCAHPDLVYARIIPLHGPSGSHRAAGIETASAADTGPYPMPTPPHLHQPTAGAAGMACHQKDPLPGGEPGCVLRGKNGRQSGAPISPCSADAGGLSEVRLVAVERNPATGRLRASLWA